MSANFPFQENIDVFAGEKAEKEYWLKISSKDATSTSPFNFNVKFNMRINNYDVDSSGNQKIFKSTFSTLANKQTTPFPLVKYKAANKIERRIPRD